MHSPFEASPLSPGAILRPSWRLYRRHWRAWLGLSLLTYVPLLLITQLTNIAPELGNPAPWGWLLVTLALCFQALVMNGAGAIFVADSLRGERPTIRYALDLLFTQRLGRVFLMWLLVTILTDVISLPLLPLTLLGFLPYATAIALIDALPWIAGIGLLLAAVALLATRRQRYFPLLLAVAFVVIYSLVVIHAPDQSRDVQRILILFSQGMRLLLNALFLLLVPIVALDPGPLWRTAARGWQIAKQNLPLIFVTLFLIGLATGLLENLVQALAYLLPDLLTPNRTVFLGPWQVESNYVNALIYYLPLSLIFVAAVFTPLQAIFATVVTLDGYWLSDAEGKDEEDEEAEWDEEDAEDEHVESDDEAIVPPVNASDSSAEATDEPDESEEEAEEGEEEDDFQPTDAHPLLNYLDLAYFAVLMVAGTVFSYLSNTILDAVVNWLNQLIA